MKVLKELRLLHGYTQKEMAKVLDLTAVYYQMLETGQRRLNSDMLNNLKKAFPEFDMNNLFQNKTESREVKFAIQEPTHEELVKACNPATDFLAKNYDLHTQIVISIDRVDVVQEIFGTKIKNSSN